jgi:hypothetical protein
LARGQSKFRTCGGRITQGKGDRRKLPDGFVQLAKVRPHFIRCLHGTSLLSSLMVVPGQVDRLATDASRMVRSHSGFVTP